MTNGTTRLTEVKMKANELRIGNWIMIDPHNSPQQVCDVMCDCVNTENVQGAHYGLVDAIPLTEEWLFNFGFKYRAIGTEFVGHNMILHNWILDRGYVLWGVVKLKHVHQLQNLYFALNGEELKMESEK